MGRKRIYANAKERKRAQRRREREARRVMNENKVVIHPDGTVDLGLTTSELRTALEKACREISERKEAWSNLW